jgi:hypothetical protein
VPTAVVDRSPRHAHRWTILLEPHRAPRDRLGNFADLASEIPDVLLCLFDEPFKDTQTDLETKHLLLFIGQRCAAGRLVPRWLVDEQA